MKPSVYSLAIKPEPLKRLFPPILSVKEFYCLFSSKNFFFKIFLLLEQVAKFIIISHSDPQKFDDQESQYNTQTQAKLNNNIQLFTKTFKKLESLNHP